MPCTTAPIMAALILVAAIVFVATRKKATPEPSASAPAAVTADNIIEAVRRQASLERDHQKA